MDKKEMWKVLGRDDYAHKSQELKKKCEELEALPSLGDESDVPHVARHG